MKHEEIKYDLQDLASKANAYFTQEKTLMSLENRRASIIKEQSHLCKAPEQVYKQLHTELQQKMRDSRSELLNALKVMQMNIDGIIAYLSNTDDNGKE